jgi:predicted nucleic acid-binding protein
MLRAASRDVIAGGRIYDAHIAEIARAAGAAVVVTDNRRHFLSALATDCGSIHLRNFWRV